MKRLLLFTITIASLSLTGCATTGPGHVGSYPGFSQHAFHIKGSEYVPASRIAAHYDMNYKWDSPSRKVILKKGREKFVFAAGSNLVLFNNKIEKMQQPALIHQGVLAVPLNFIDNRLVRQIEDRGIRIQVLPIPVIETKKPYVVSPTHRISRIVIDPGHGGKDPGAVGKAGLKEKDIVLDVAKRLNKKLKAKGIKSILTRSKDVFIPLGKRARIANRNDADFFISIHANASRYRGVRGVEAYYLSDAVDDSARALAAAENASLKFENRKFSDASNNDDLEATLWDIIYTENRVESIELASRICREASRKLYARNRGVKGARFYVLKGARMPAILIEVGFISNKKEEARLKDNRYREKIADAILKGILVYKKEYEATDGFTR